MKILMLAPEPFFQPRGTPISVYFRTMALSDLGHEVDLVTYPLGEDVSFKNLRIFRVRNVLRLKKIKMERFILKNSHSIIVICPDLMSRVKAGNFGPYQGVSLLLEAAVLIREAGISFDRRRLRCGPSSREPRDSSGAASLNP